VPRLALPAPALSPAHIDELFGVRNPSAVASSAGYKSQRRQPAEQQILNAANGVNSDNAQFVSFASSRSCPDAGKAAILPQQSLPPSESVGRLSIELR
jgi:hypothetical protein